LTKWDPATGSIHPHEGEKVVKGTSAPRGTKLLWKRRRLELSLAGGSPVDGNGLVPGLK